MTALEAALISFGIGAVGAVASGLTLAFERWQHRRIRRDYVARRLRR